VGERSWLESGGLTAGTWNHRDALSKTRARSLQSLGRFAASGEFPQAREDAFHSRSGGPRNTGSLLVTAVTSRTAQTCCPAPAWEVNRVQAQVSAWRGPPVRPPRSLRTTTAVSWGRRAA
jgi:hypothetical protein